MHLSTFYDSFRWDPSVHLICIVVVCWFRVRLVCPSCCDPFHTNIGQMALCSISLYTHWLTWHSAIYFDIELQMATSSPDGQGTVSQRGTTNKE
ncbi:hypothetical protein SODALDRAFT_135128 [Sodiomyces alkalinus F11]|uniref:Uncharacterized protein n=1 Tax=Sodiomyces alkalinus (strain CBS 110278 / VKM F-3762 / F11) TaxID=1314773 RepID=A0A3N2PZ16_SODAK|nr:hypothetical protein SODALDRAFT_135128 [Sodiomyces alkalinus F11]ROT39668.1 hypothetical protein SODALDRAFT_135128 [Sodiomyces alkalinus F11]